MKEFLTETQLFWAIPDYNSNIVISLGIISLIFTIAAISVWFGMKKIILKMPPYQELKNSLTSLFSTIGIIGLFLTLFGWQLIPYLSSRVLILALAIIFIIWLIYILIHIKRKFSRELEKFRQDERYKKYLPKAKSK